MGTAPRFGLSFGGCPAGSLYFYRTTQKDGAVVRCRKCGGRFKKGDRACNGDPVKYTPWNER
jgi:PHP family Zn ribbon phosphoesterase